MPLARTERLLAAVSAANIPPFLLAVHAGRAWAAALAAALGLSSLALAFRVRRWS